MQRGKGYYRPLIGGGSLCHRSSKLKEEARLGFWGCGKTCEEWLRTRPGTRILRRRNVKPDGIKSKINATGGGRTFSMFLSSLRIPPRGIGGQPRGLEVRENNAIPGSCLHHGTLWETGGKKENSRHQPFSEGDSIGPLRTGGGQKTGE